MRYEEEDLNFVEEEEELDVEEEESMPSHSFFCYFNFKLYSSFSQTLKMLNLKSNFLC